MSGGPFTHKDENGRASNARVQGGQGAQRFDFKEARFYFRRKPIGNPFAEGSD
jgi:hypothetical protein